MARGREKAAVLSAPVEGRWELPEGWRWLRANQFSKIVGGGTPKNATDEANYDPNGIPWLTPADLSGYNQQTIGRGRRSLSAHGFANSSAKMLPAGAVLISSRAPVGYCAVASNPVSTNQGFRSLLLDEGIDPFFIRYYVLYSRDYLEEHASGTTFKELSGGALGELLFPIPPLETQRRIVARIDELFSELDDGEAALARAREDLEIYRKALLKAAVTGELTADWRAANPPKETGEQHLKRILSERRARWEADPKNKGKRYKEPATPDTSGLPELPEGWTWMTVAQLTYCGPSNGYSPPRSKTEGGVPALKLTATTSGKMRLDNDCIKLVNAEIDPNSDLFLQPGDVVFQRGNTREYVGIAAVYNGPSSTYIYPDLMIRVRPVSPMLGNWIWKYANSPFGRRYMMENAKGASGSMPKITGEVIRSCAVPVPPMNELEELLSRIEAGEGQHTELTDALQTSDPLHFLLRQSILAAAFKGELVQ